MTPAQGQDAQAMVAAPTLRDGVYYRARDGRRICGAKSRTNPTGICHQAVGLHPKTGRCKNHKGGSGRTGALNGQFKHGRYSQALPVRLVAAYQAAQDDPEALSLREEIALTETRLVDLLGRVDAGETADAWREAQRLWHSMRAANARGDQAAMQTAANGLERVLTRGASDARAWREVRDTIEQRRKLVESERERLVQAHQMITVERALLLVGALSQVINQHVPDPTARSAIADELLRLTEGAARRGD